jgi:hypothetical protein
MSHWTFWSLALFAIVSPASYGQELVPAPGSNVQYPTAIANFGAGLDQPVDLTLTGVAMRKKLVFNVYTLASYIQAGAKVATAAELVRADVPKMLHLVMQRAVDGPSMAESFKVALAAGHPGKFAVEQDKLSGFLHGLTAEKGQSVWIIHVPGKGVRFVVGEEQLFVPGVAFAQAIWDIYLGPATIDAAIRTGLTSRIGS